MIKSCQARGLDRNRSCRARCIRLRSRAFEEASPAALLVRARRPLLVCEAFRWKSAAHSIEAGTLLRPAEALEVGGRIAAAPFAAKRGRSDARRQRADAEGSRSIARPTTRPAGIIAQCCISGCRGASMRSRSLAVTAVIPQALGTRRASDSTTGTCCRRLGACYSVSKAARSSVTVSPPL
jgi:hypothetical protein